MFKKAAIGITILLAILVISCLIFLKTNTDIDENEVQYLGALPEIPNSLDNGYFDLIDACRLIQEMPYIDEVDNTIYPFDPEKVDWLRLEAELARNQPVLDLMDNLLTKPKFAYPQHIENIDDYFVELGKLRELANLITYKARVLIRSNNLMDAFKILLRGRNIIAKCSSCSPSYVHLLFNNSIHNIYNYFILEQLYKNTFTAEKLEFILKNLKLSRYPDSSIENGLRCELHLMKHYSKKMFDENGYANLDELGMMTPVFMTSVTGSSFLHPNRARNDLAIIFKELLAQSNRPLNRIVSPHSEHLLSMNDFEMIAGGYWLSHELVQVFGDVMTLHKTTLLSDETLELLIALRLYELENKTVPPTLAALIPKYFNSVPIDPYDGSPLRYDSTKRKIWSVNQDFTDQGGLIIEPESNGVYEPQLTHDLDVAMDLGFYLLPGPPKKPIKPTPPPVPTSKNPDKSESF